MGRGRDGWDLRRLGLGLGPIASANRTVRHDRSGCGRSVPRRSPSLPIGPWRVGASRSPWSATATGTARGCSPGDAPTRPRHRWPGPALTETRGCGPDPAQGHAGQRRGRDRTTAGGTPANRERGIGRSSSHSPSRARGPWPGSRSSRQGRKLQPGSTWPGQARDNFRRGPASGLPSATTGLGPCVCASPPPASGPPPDRSAGAGIGRSPPGARAGAILALPRSARNPCPPPARHTGHQLRAPQRRTILAAAPNATTVVARVRAIPPSNLVRPARCQAGERVPDRAPVAARR